MAERLEIKRLKVLPDPLAPSTLYITRTPGNPKLIDLTMTGDTIAEVRKVMGIVEVSDVINNILESWVPARALRSDNSDAAAKLAKKVNVKLQGDVTGQAQWDGSTDLIINTTGGGTGPGPGPALPIEFYYDDFTDPNDTGDEFLGPDMPVMRSSIAGLVYTGSTRGALKTSGGLQVDPGGEMDIARVTFDTSDIEGANSRYFGTIVYRCQFRLITDFNYERIPTPLKLSFGTGGEDGSFECRLDVITGDGRPNLKFSYGAYAENSVYIPFEDGRYSIEARHNGNTVSIRLLYWISEYENLQMFKYQDGEVRTDMDWGWFNMDFGSPVTVEEIQGLGI